MIAFTMKSKDGDNILGIGLTDKNIENLKEGKPILKEISSYVEGDLDKIIFLYGKTEFSLMSELKKAGILSNKTKVHSEGFLVNE